MNFTGTSQDLPLNLLPRVEHDFMRLWDLLDKPTARLYYVHGLVANNCAPLVQPPKEVEQVTEISTKQEALVSFFTSERGADRFRSYLQKRYNYNGSKMATGSIEVRDVLDMMRDVSDQFEEDIGITVRAEAYLVRDEMPVVGDVIFSDRIRKI